MCSCLFIRMIYLMFMLLCLCKLSDACISLNDRDLFNDIDGMSWESHNDSVKYEISICQRLSDVSANNPCSATPQAAVCQTDKDGHSVVIANFTTTPNVTENTKDGVIQLKLQGAPCPGTTDFYTTLIDFKCGKTLGSPVFLESYACGINFEWYTRSACSDPATVQEAKCYVYNDKNQKIDLGPLTKVTGGHKVLRFGDEFYINVCRDITPGTGSTEKCDADSAACFLSGNSQKNGGHVKLPLYLDDSGRPTIKYLTEMKGDEIPADCTQAPSTTITFVCPARGKSSSPTLFSEVDCQYVIMWNTEYACPEENLVSQTCKLNEDIHGINLDLSSLQGPAHSASGSNLAGTREYRYYVSVCGEISGGCPDADHKDGSAACQTALDDVDFGKSLGKANEMQLRYSDGELILMYKGGAKCHTNFQRRTIINFHCDSSATGTGEPIYASEDDCVYIFDWNTPLACVSSMLDTTCQVEGQGHFFDLSDLVITEDSREDYWEALTSGEDDSAFLILNVCKELVHKGLAALCEDGAAVCVMDQPGHWLNLGRPSNPTYDENSQQVQIHYTGGSPCGQNSHYDSVVTFLCEPGTSPGTPRLVRKSECHYEIEWETSAVCTQHQVTGDHCQVTDPVLGLTFDLRPLTDVTSGYYKVSHPETGHDYYINVCAALTGSPCNTGEKQDVHDMAACQADTSGNIFDAGKVNTSLQYGDDFLKLTYTGGDAYNSEPKRPRTTEIAFFCNPTAGKGHPEFVERTNYTYVFRWYTSYACADVPVECAVTDENTNDQYDLTSLVRKPTQSDWVTVDDEQTDGKKRTFYINVCHHLVDNVDGCDSQSSICEKTLIGSEDKVSHASLGRSRTRPVIDSKGELTLLYTGGVTCDTNITANYTAKLHLHCDHGVIESSPRLIGIDPAVCEYVFSWDHAAACPVEHVISAPGDICTLTDPELGFTYNLKPLMAHDYNISQGADVYKLHVCGAVAGQCQRIGEKDPSVCLGQQTLGEVSTKLETSEQGHLTLTYKGTRDTLTDSFNKVIIEFRCDRSVGEGQPKFIEKDGLVTLFRFATTYACPPATTECKAVDDRGSLYDLSYLAKDTGNWEVIDTRLDHGDLRYYINVCRPVNTMAGSTSFCTGLAGSCQTNGENKSYSLGYLQGAPTAPSQGTVILRYTGGDKCHKDKPGENYRSTTITFNCANSEHDPVFVKETDDCEYHFSWETPLACPITKATGSSCKVMEPHFFMTFDLSALKASSPYKIPVGDYMYLLNVCGNVNETGECQGAGACQTKPSSGMKINAGKENSQLIYEDGELRLVYTEGKADCHGLYTRQTIITFTCDMEAGDGKPIYLNESSTCQYLFEWRTSRACAPSGEEYRACSVQDSSGKQYDLSGLRASSSNYVYIDTPRKLKYIVNVCAPVLHGHDAACASDSAVCLVHLNTTTDRYENLGSFTTSVITVESDMVLLKYTGGRSCKDGRSASVTIKMVCETGEVASVPYLLEDGEDCDYVFQWMTSRACPLGTNVPTGGECSATNPQTGVTLSLAKLKGRSWTVEDNKGHSYDIGVCGPLSASRCGDNAASCQYDTNDPTHYWLSGQANSNLLYNDGTLHLVYTGGAKCHNGAYTRSTVIDFVCGTADQGENKPVFITEDANCTYFLSWHTQLACETPPVPCEADAGDSVYDLSSLVLSDGYHSAITSPGTGDGASFYINLCRPLNPIQGAACPPQAAVCQVDTTGKAMSLGEVVQGPSKDPKTNKVTIVMEHGAICPSDRTRKWKTTIIFECLHGVSSGSPSLDEYDVSNCEAVFTWPTFLVCAADTSPDVDNDCTFTDPRRNYEYDFTDLKHAPGENGLTLLAKHNSGTYYVNVCGSTSASGATCGSAGVCLVKDGKATSFGRADKMSFLASDFNVKLVYKDGLTCENGKPRQSFVLLECDYYATVEGSSNLKLFSEQNCSVGFTYKTHLACPPVTRECIFAHSGTTYDLTPLSRLTGSWEIQDEDGNFYWFNLCRGVRDGPVTGCPANAAICWQASGGAPVKSLARVSSQTASMDGSGNIELEYTDGDSTCRGGAGKKGDPRVKINLICGNGIGKPTVKSSSQSPCLFELEWKTTYACKEKSEPVFANKGMITDPQTQLQIPIQQLSDGRTYEVLDKPYKYIVNLEGSPATDSQECSNMVVCKTRSDDLSYHDSLGEKDTQTFFIKGEILQAHYTSPTVCTSHGNMKATTVIDFHCSTDNSTVGPVFVYKSQKCQYIFDWNTPAVCSLAQVNHPGTAGTGSSGNSHVMSTAALWAVLGVSFTLLIFIVAALILYNPSRRARVLFAIRRVFRKSDNTSYSYSQLSQAEEDSSLLRSSRGQYGADSNQLGNVQNFLDDSDEDILQL